MISCFSCSTDRATGPTGPGRALPTDSYEYRRELIGLYRPSYETDRTWSGSTDRATGPTEPDLALPSKAWDRQDLVGLYRPSNETDRTWSGSTDRATRPPGPGRALPTDSYEYRRELIGLYRPSYETAGPGRALPTDIAHRAFSESCICIVQEYLLSPTIVWNFVGIKPSLSPPLSFVFSSCEI